MLFSSLFSFLQLFPAKLRTICETAKKTARKHHCGRGNLMLPSQTPSLQGIDAIIGLNRSRNTGLSNKGGCVRMNGTAPFFALTTNQHELHELFNCCLSANYKFVQFVQFVVWKLFHCFDTSSSWPEAHELLTESSRGLGRKLTRSWPMTHELLAESSCAYVQVLATGRGCRLMGSMVSADRQG